MLPGNRESIAHQPSTAFLAARWMLRRVQRGFGRPFQTIPARVWGGDAIMVETEAGPLLVPVNDLSVRSVLIFGHLRHERTETKLLAEIFRRTQRVLDIGANLGWYSFLARQSNPQAEIHAFDANPDILPYLRANASARNVIVHETAVSDHTGTIDFYCAPGSAYSSATRDVGSHISVPAVALDNLAIGPVDFVKLDVEGGELAVLRGSRQMRSRSPRAIWMIEADEAMLREAGASLEAIDEELALPASTRLYTVDPAGAWQPLSAFADMHGALHKNVLVVPGDVSIEQLQRNRVPELPQPRAGSTA